MRRHILIPVVFAIAALAGCQQLPPQPLPQNPIQLPAYQLMVNPYDTSRPPGTGTYNVGVIPTRWYFKFTGDDHHFGAQELDTYGITVGPEWVDWQNFVRFRDKNGDDLYKWYLQSTIVGMHHSFMYVQKRAFLGGDRKSSDVISESYENTQLKGFDAATVVLIGWRLQFWDPGNADHHILKMGIRIQNVSYDSGAGKINWTVRSYLSDKNGDDRYVWGYSYLIIAFNDGAVLSEAYTDLLGDNKPKLQGTMQAPVAGRNRNHGIVLLQGWHYNAFGLAFVGDAHIKTHRLWLDNRSFDGSTISFTADIRFPVGGAEFLRIVTLDLVGLFFDNGGVGIYPVETDWAPDGWPGKDYREVRFRYFFPLNFPVP